jgi:ferric-dicitrate binding protein FerR (iron transport regulator)
MKIAVRAAVGVALGLAFALSLITGAWAAEMSGKIQTVNASDRAVVLDDGTTLWLAEGVQIEGLKEGARVKVSYEQRDGKMVATGIEVE